VIGTQAAGSLNASLQKSASECEIWRNSFGKIAGFGIRKNNFDSETDDLLADRLGFGDQRSSRNFHLCYPPTAR
jgi:hypothetical protein